MKKRILSIALLLSMVFAFTACKAASIERPKVDAGATMIEITGECNAEVAGNIIAVTASTNILDGALIKISILSLSGRELASKTVTKAGDTVAAEFDVSVLGGEKEFYAFASCAPTHYGKQPEAVLTKYGAKFELMDGKWIVWDLKGVIAAIGSGKVTVK